MTHEKVVATKMQLPEGYSGKRMQFAVIDEVLQKQCELIDKTLDDLLQEIITRHNVTMKDLRLGRYGDPSGMETYQIHVLGQDMKYKVETATTYKEGRGTFTIYITRPKTTT